MHRDFLSGARGMGWFDFFAIDFDVAFLNEPLDGPARDRWKLRAQESIQPFPGQ